MDESDWRNGQIVSKLPHHSYEIETENGNVLKVKLLMYLVACMLLKRATHHDAFTAAQPTYLHSLIIVQPPHGTCYSSVVTLSQPPTSFL